MIFKLNTQKSIAHVSGRSDAGRFSGKSGVQTGIGAGATRAIPANSAGTVRPGGKPAGGWF